MDRERLYMEHVEYAVFLFYIGGVKQKCMTEYLSGKIVFRKPYQAYGRGNLEKQVEAMAELEIIGKIYKI